MMLHMVRIMGNAALQGVPYEFAVRTSSTNPNLGGRSIDHLIE
jgi:hypothetical protein